MIELRTKALSNSTLVLKQHNINLAYVRMCVDVDEDRPQVQVTQQLRNLFQTLNDTTFVFTHPLYKFKSKLSLSSEGCLKTDFAPLEKRLQFVGLLGRRGHKIDFDFEQRVQMKTKQVSRRLPCASF